MEDVEQGDGDYESEHHETPGKSEHCEDHSESEPHNPNHNGGPGHHMDQMEDGHGGHGGGPDFGGPMRGGFWRGPRPGPGPGGPPWRGPPPPRFRGRGGPPGPPWNGPPGPRGPWRGPPPPPFFRGPRPPFRGGPPFDPNWGPHPGMMGPGGPMGPYPPGPPGMGGPGMGPPPPGSWGGPPGGPMGPPAGPPPFSGPPPGHHSAPPPQFGGMNLANVWVETKNDDGKPYYYNAQSRETTWTKPEGDGVRILTQQEVEQMTQSVGGPANAAAGGPGGPGRGKSESETDGDNSQDSENKDSSGGGDGSGGPGAAGAGGGGGPAVQVPSGPPPFAGPPGGGPGGHPGGQFNMPPPSWMGGPWGGGGQGGPAGWAPGAGPPPTNTQMPPPTQQVIQGAPSVDNKELDPELVAKAAEWTEHTAPDGRKYYYNAKSQQSVWVKPQAITDLEAARLAAQQQVAAAAAAAVAAGDVKAADPPELKLAAAAPAPAAAAAAAEDDHESADDGMDVDDDESSQSASETKEEPAPAKPEDKSRPVSSTPVPGSPWCVVWTGDGRVFFYNPSSRTSVWERPEDLNGRADVDKMLQPPKQLELAETKEDEPPAKKAKLEEPKKEVKDEAPKKIDVGKEAAIEAEVRAARERAIVPLEIRMKQFRDMLAEKEVSAFSTWEKELHKIVFDPRYLLLTSRERKQVFDKYVKERAEEERREKRNKMRETKEEFRKLLADADLSGKTSFSEFAQKYGKDERFRGVEKMRERESLYNEHLLEIRRKEKEERAAKREQVKKDFFSMLRDDKSIDHHAHWSDVKKRLDSDTRYRAVESSGQREDWFRDHVHDLKEERRREKRKEKEKKKKRSRSRSKDRRSKSRDGRKENGERDSEERKSEAGSKTREDGEKTDEDSEEEEERKKKETEEREKQERVQTSLREREKEVQRTLAEHLRDRDKEREQHKHAEAVQHMLAVLADLVRTTDITWREAKKVLKKDHRWQLLDSLEKDEKEKLFEQHVEQLSKKKKEKFRELLEEMNVELTSSWKDVKKLIKDDVRYSKFSSSDRKCEREYREFIKDKLVVAKSDFRELLKETKIITHESLKKINNDQHMKDILEVLRKDKRYLQLEDIAEEREQMIVSYLEDLDKRGPPPPPTASEPSRRLVK